MKDSPSPETQRRPFTDRPIKQDLRDLTAKTVSPGHAREAEVAEQRTLKTETFRKKKSIPINPELGRLLGTDAAKSEVSALKRTMTPRQQSMSINENSVSPKFLDDLHANITKKARESRSQTASRDYQNLADKIVKSVKDPDWSKAVSTAKKEQRIQKTGDSADFLLNPKVSDADLSSSLEGLLGTKPSAEFTTRVRDLQKMARTKAAAEADATMDEISMPTRPGLKTAGAGVAVVTGHPYVGATLSWSALKDFIRPFKGKAKEKMAADILEAMADPEKAKAALSNRGKKFEVPAGGLLELFGGRDAE